MKKFILGALAIIGLVNHSFGQGELQIVNSSYASTKIFLNDVADGQSTGQVGVVLPGNGTASYMFELFYNTTVNLGAGAPNVADSATPWLGGGWVDSGVTANNGALAGRIIVDAQDDAAGFSTLPTSAASAVGVQANLEMIGWNTAVGGSSLSSFITAYNAGAEGLVYGYSGVANILLGDNVAPANSNFFSVPNGGASGFTLGLIGTSSGSTSAGALIAPVPEPATLALASLGGLGLLGLRRKK